MKGMQEIALPLATCFSHNLSCLFLWIHLCKVGCTVVMLFKMARLYFLPHLSHQSSQTNFAVSLRQENYNFHCFLSILFFQWQSLVTFSQKWHSSRCSLAKAAMLKNKSLLEWSGSKENAVKFLLLPKCLPNAPVLFEWCQVLYGL